MSFCVAGVALYDILTCLQKCQKSFCARGNICARLSEDECHFRGRRDTLDVSMFILHGKRSALDVSCCVFFANRIGSAASSREKV